jgi:hypothetical protein
MQDKHDEIPHTRDEMRSLHRRSIDVLRVGTLNFVPTFQNWSCRPECMPLSQICEARLLGSTANAVNHGPDCQPGPTCNGWNILKTWQKNSNSAETEMSGAEI